MKLPEKFKVRKWLIIAGVIVLGVTGIGLAKKFQIKPVNDVVNYVVAPIEKVLNVVTSGISSITTHFKDVDTILADNKILKQNNDKLLYENSILQEYKTENDKLKSLLEMQQQYKEYPSTGANVIGKDSSNWYKVFTVDKGRHAGILDDSVILAEGGLVGYVYQADPLSSLVLSIIDDRSAVVSKVLRTGDSGILKGDIELINEGLCRLELGIEAEVVKGDQIVTSHLSEIYPPGIPIGLVESVELDENGLMQYAYVRPFVDFKHLQSVLIIEKTN